MAVIDAKVIRSHLGGRTTQDLCDDFEHLVNARRPMPWAQQAIADALFERNEVAWIEWQLGGNLFGPTMPHRFFGLI